MLAAYGSGAARASHDLGKRAAQHRHRRRHHQARDHREGQGAATAAIHIGGRLQVTDATARITRLDPAGRHHAAAAGFDWYLGDTVAQSDLDTVAARMAATLAGGAALSPLPAEVVRLLYLTDPIEDFGRHRRRHRLGRRRRICLWPRGARFRRHGQAAGHSLPERARWPRLAAAAGRRLHPRHRARRLRIHRPALRQHRPHQQPRQAVAAAEHAGRAASRCRWASASIPAAIAAAIRAHFVAFDLENADADVALALRWEGHPEYTRLRAFAEGMRDGLAAQDRAGAADLPHAGRRRRDDAGRILAEGARHGQRHAGDRQRAAA